MTPTQAKEVAATIAMMGGEWADGMDFVGLQITPTTDDDVSLAVTMRAMGGTGDWTEAEGRDPVTLSSQWTESGDVHDFMALIASDGAILANLEVQ